MSETIQENFIPTEEMTDNATETTDTEISEIQPAESDAPLSREEEKRLAAKYLVFAAITLAGIYIAQLFHLLDPLFDRIYYGNLTMVFFYACNAIFWVPFIIVLCRQAVKYTGYHPIRRTKKELTLKRSLIIYACTIVPIFIVSAALGFNIKIVYELGKRVTGMQLLSNAIMYVHGGVKLILAIIFLEFVQEAADLLYKGKYHRRIPWGGFALALIYGFAEVIVSYASGGFSMFAWLYIAFDLLYGVIYLLSERNFPVTYFVSLIIYIL